MSKKNRGQEIASKMFNDWADSMKYLLHEERESARRTFPSRTRLTIVSSRSRALTTLGYNAPLHKHHSFLPRLILDTRYL
jgi:hypothetical protein